MKRKPAQTIGFSLAKLVAVALMSCTAAAEEPIRIADFSVDKARVGVGEPFTVTVLATGGANFGVRHDRAATPEIALPGWTAHGPDYEFVPSADFPGPGPYKNPHICHRDNGQRDRDQREGVFRIEVETAGWPKGLYTFTLLATNRPQVGPNRGDVRTFQIAVGVDAEVFSSRPSRHVDLVLNGISPRSGAVLGRIYPCRPNHLTVRASEEGSRKHFDVDLVHIQPDGHTEHQSITLTPDQPEGTLDLGLFAVPAAFQYEAGVVYRRGCRFELTLREPGTEEPVEKIPLFQDIGDSRTAEVLRAGDAERVVHLGWRSPNGPRPMDPPILLWLDAKVLTNPDDLVVRYQLRGKEKSLRPEWSLESISALLRVTRASDGQVLVEKPIEIDTRGGSEPIEVNDWAEGEHRIELVPRVKGTGDRQGPAVVYRRKGPAPEVVRLSPLAPWHFIRDTSRPDLDVKDFREAIGQWSGGLPAEGDWELRPLGPGRVALVSPDGQWRNPPVVLRPGLKGVYAVFAEAHEGCGYVQVGRKGLIRRVGEDGVCYVDAADFSDDQIAVYPAKGAGIHRLRFVPVTEESVEATLSAARRPPTPLYGVADWCDYFHGPPPHLSAAVRLGEDQFDVLLGGQRELGISSIAWAIGRSWVEYHSKLPNTTRFPCVPLDTVPRKYQDIYGGRVFMINQHRPLEHVLGARDRFEMKILPWLAMQRHYGPGAYGGMFASQWFREHPEWRRYSKTGKPSGSTVSYYFPEVRKERVDILVEVAEKSPDGLVIGACRQVPMLGYHPKMVAAYQEKTGIDPTNIDATQREQYLDWIRWRADFFTEVLRELKQRLAPIRETRNQPIPVIGRIPSKGLFYNLAQGLDVQTWLREGLVDQLYLDPLEDCDGRGSPHDIRPYLELGRTFKVPVLGGVNGNTFWNYSVIMRRSLGLLQAGVDGIEFYESNNFAVADHKRWVVPLLGNEPLLEEFLKRSNLEACYPIRSRDAAAGHDNHSFGGKWSVYGPDSL